MNVSSFSFAHHISDQCMRLIIRIIMISILRYSAKMLKNRYTVKNAQRFFIKFLLDATARKYNKRPNFLWCTSTSFPVNYWLREIQIYKQKKQQLARTPCFFFVFFIVWKSIQYFKSIKIAAVSGCIALNLIFITE